MEDLRLQTERGALTRLTKGDSSHPVPVSGTRSHSSTRSFKERTGIPPGVQGCPGWINGRMYTREVVIYGGNESSPFSLRMCMSNRKGRTDNINLPIYGSVLSPFHVLPKVLLEMAVWICISQLLIKLEFSGGSEAFQRGFLHSTKTCLIKIQFALIPPKLQSHLESVACALLDLLSFSLLLIITR